MDLLSRVDHLVYATPDLNLAVESLAERLGIRPTAGGQHPTWGTRNALMALGPTSYVEIVGPDPDQPKLETSRVFGIDSLESPSLVAWAANAPDLDRLVTEARRQGIALGELASGSRHRPDGLVLSWRFTNPRTVVADGIVPFFIDWGTMPHPARTAAAGTSLVGLRAEHPSPAHVQELLAKLGLDLPVQPGPRPPLIAILSTPRGLVELR